MKLKKKAKAHKSNNNSLLINFVLDKSGSMGSVREAVTSGFNEFKLDQSQEGETWMSLTLFDTRTQLSYVNRPIDKCEDLSVHNYVPGGLTALYDAAGSAIRALEQNLTDFEVLPEKVLFVIYTDGGENASREFTQAQVREMIITCREKYGWEFIFLGADQDAWAAGSTIGVFSKSHTVSFENTAMGHTQTFATLSSATTTYRSATSKTVDSYFTPTDSVTKVEEDDE